MKIALTPDAVKRLRLDFKPLSFDTKGKLVWGDVAEELQKEYIVFCSDQNSPKGFGVRVAKKKTYIIQRRVKGENKVIKATIGDCADLTLEEARERARAYGVTIKDKGRNPNELAKEISAAEITVGGAMSAYKLHLQTRKNKQAKPNTITNFERAERRFKELGWWEKKVKELSAQDIIDAFQKKADSAPTANEQNFTWLMTAMKHAIDLEAYTAAGQNRLPTITTNPFVILKLKGLYRDPAVVEEQRSKNRTVNPLGPSTTLGPFLEAAWARRSINDNATGVDFIITELLVGSRKGETGRLKWGDMLTQQQRDNGEVSHLWLDEGDYGPYLFFCREDTKNRRAHRVPVGPFLANLLRMRRNEAADKTLSEGFGRRGREWVFPARNKTASLAGGHYKDAGALMDNIAIEVGLRFLNPHDLRRTFGAVMTALQVPGTVQSVLFNHTSSKPKTDEDIAAAVTARYNRPEWALLREWAEKIQEYIFLQAPNIYNNVRPEVRPAIPAPPPHVPNPPKPRTGRPRKELLKERLEQEAVDYLEGGAGVA
jgi:integrase